MRPIDIGPADLETIRHILRDHVPGLEVHAFGSRVSWTARATSDLDLVLMTAEPLSIARVAELRAAFTESDLPFRVDLVDWASTSETFRKVIEAEHVLLVKKDNSAFASDDWVSLRLGAVCTKIGSGATPRGGKDVYLKGGPFSLIRSQNIYNDGLRHDGLAFITQHQATELNNVEVRTDDVLLNITGDSVARACQVAPDVLPARVNQHVAIIRPDSRKLSARFLRYFLVHPKSQAMLLSWAGSGGTRNALTKSMIESFRVYAPTDVAEQCAIAHILGTLDDKIELNRRMNETLEALARALFTSWFVNFDPVRAKMESRDTGLPKHIADLFPDRLVDSELGEIPEGWTVGTLGDCFDLTMGQSPPSSTYNEHGEGTPFFQGRSDFGFRYPKNRTFCTAPTRIALADDTLVSVRAPVGEINVSWERCCVGRGVAGLRHKSGLSSYTYYAVEALRPEIRQYEHTGTVFGAITKKQFEALRVIEAPGGIAELFEDHVIPLDRHIRTATAEIRTLAGLRDTLLPKLVSGELRVNLGEPARPHGEPRTPAAAAHS